MQEKFAQPKFRSSKVQSPKVQSEVKEKIGEKIEEKTKVTIEAQVDIATSDMAMSDMATSHGSASGAVLDGESSLTKKVSSDKQQDEQQGKQKVTLYIQPELHRKLKVRSALDDESMSALAERAVAFYLANQAVVDGVETHGRTHQIYACPECASSLILREGELVSLTQVLAQSQSSSVGVGSGILSDGEGEGSFPDQQERLVPC